MKRPWELPLVLAVTVFTVWGAGTAIRNLSDGQLRGVAQALEKKWHDINPLAPAPAPAVSAAAQSTNPSTAPQEVSKGAPEPAVGRSSSESGQDNTAASQGIPTTWSRQDLQEAQNIMSDFASSMSGADWTEVMNDLTSNSTKAQQDLSQLILTHLTPQDKSWIQAHFSGQAAFNTDDVQLLQQTVSELESELTPDEQKMLQQQLEKFMESPTQK